MKFDPSRRIIAKGRPFGTLHASTDVLDITISLRDEDIRKQDTGEPDASGVCKASGLPKPATGKSNSYANESRRQASGSNSLGLSKQPRQPSTSALVSGANLTKSTTQMIFINDTSYEITRKMLLDCPHRVDNGFCRDKHYHSSFQWGPYSSLDGNFCIAMPSGERYVRLTLPQLAKICCNKDLPHLSDEALSAQLTAYDVCPGSTRQHLIWQLHQLLKYGEGLAEVPYHVMALDLKWRKQRILAMVQNGMPPLLALARELDPMEWQTVLGCDEESRNEEDNDEVLGIEPLSRKRFFVILAILFPYRVFQGLQNQADPAPGDTISRLRSQQDFRPIEHHNSLAGKGDGGPGFRLFR